MENIIPFMLFYYIKIEYHIHRSERRTSGIANQHSTDNGKAVERL